MSPLPPTRSSSPKRNLSEAQNYIAVLEKQIIYYRERCKALNHQILAAKEESQCGANFVEKISRRSSELYRKSVNRRESDAKRLKIHERAGASTSNNHLTISSQNRSSKSDELESHVHSPVQELCETAHLAVSSQNRSSKSDELDSHVHSPVQELSETAHLAVSGQNRSSNSDELDSHVHSPVQKFISHCSSEDRSNDST